MVISTKYNPYQLQLHLNNQAIERVNDITFLGIHISAKLSWNIHIDVICKKARRINGLIHRNFHLAPEHFRHTLYISLVRPILEYSCATWHSLNKTLTNRLESVQRFTCQVILHSWNLEHDDLLSRTSLPTLEARRECSTVVQVFQILDGLSSAPNIFNPHTRSDSRRYHSHALYIPFSGATGGVGQGAECPQRLLTGKFLLTYREKRGKEKRENGEKGKFKKGKWKIENVRRKS